MDVIKLARRRAERGLALLQARGGDLSHIDCHTLDLGDM